LIAVFGALWGLMEITLGTALKGTRLPFSGAILASVAAVIALTGRHFVHHNGAILLMGGVAALLKIFSTGMVIAGPFLAILLEALCAEFIVILFGTGRLGCILAGTVVVGYTALHPFITQAFLYGGRIFEVYWAIFQQIKSWLHLEFVHFAFFIGFYITVHALIGAAAGWYAFHLAQSAEAQLKKMEHTT